MDFLLIVGLCSKFHINRLFCRFFWFQKVVDSYEINSKEKMLQYVFTGQYASINMLQCNAIVTKTIKTNNGGQRPRQLWRNLYNACKLGFTLLDIVCFNSGSSLARVTAVTHLQPPRNTLRRVACDMMHAETFI